MLTVGVRKDLPKFAEKIPGQMQGVSFIDTDHLNIDAMIWIKDNTRTLSGAAASRTLQRL